MPLPLLPILLGAASVYLLLTNEDNEDDNRNRKQTEGAKSQGINSASGKRTRVGPYKQSRVNLVTDTGQVNETLGNDVVDNEGGGSVTTEDHTDNDDYQYTRAGQLPAD